MIFPKLISRAAAGALGFFFFATNCLFAYSTESNLWAERRKARGHPTLLASADRGAAVDPLSAQFPSAKPLGSALSQTATRLIPKNFLKDHAALLSTLSPAHGTIRKVSIPPNASPLSPVVLYIQDVHKNNEAQNNIGRMVGSLIDSRQTDLIALEGTWGALHLQAYRDFPNRQAVKAGADYLLNENRISGPIYSALTGTGPLPPLIGVDDPVHYNANIDAYRRSAPQINNLSATLDDQKNRLDKEKSRVFSPALRSFDATVEAYRSGRSSLGNFVEAMAAQTKPTGLSSTLRAFLKTLALEKSLDFKQVERERSVLILRLVEKLTPEDRETLTAQSLAYRSGQRTYADFYGYLQDLCRQAGVSLEGFPAMAEYIRYVLLADQIDAESLYEDLAILERRVFKDLAETPEAAALIEKDRANHLTRKLVDFSLTPEEWKEYRSLSSEESALSSFEDFYREAESRDIAMAENLIKAIPKGPGPSVSILVTGGFHSPGLTARLVQSGATVLRLVPRIERLDNGEGSAYLSLFTQEKTPLEQLFAGEKLFLAQTPFPNSEADLALPGMVSVADGGKTAPMQKTFTSFLSRKVRERIKRVAEQTKDGVSSLRAYFKDGWTFYIEADAGRQNDRQFRMQVLKQSLNPARLLPEQFFFLPAALATAAVASLGVATQTPLLLPLAFIFGLLTLKKFEKSFRKFHPRENARVFKTTEEHYDTTVGFAYWLIGGTTLWSLLAALAGLPGFDAWAIAGLIIKHVFGYGFLYHALFNVVSPIKALAHLSTPPRRVAKNVTLAVNMMDLGSILQRPTLGNLFATPLKMLFKGEGEKLLEMDLATILQRRIGDLWKSKVVNKLHLGSLYLETPIGRLLEKGFGNLPREELVTQRGLAKLERLLPEIAQVADEIYLTNGTIKPSEMGKMIHTVPTKSPHLRSSKNAVSRVYNYLTKRRGILDDHFGSNFSIENLQLLNPDVVDGETNDERWNRLRDFVAKAHAHGIKVKMDLIFWISPDGLGKDNWTWAETHFELREEEQNLSDEEILIRHAAHSIVKWEEDGKLVRVCVGNYMGADQVKPNINHSGYRDYVMGYLSRLIDNGVDSVRVDMAHNLISEWQDPQWSAWTAIVNGAKSHAKSRGQEFHFLMEAYTDGYGNDWPTRFLDRFPDEAVYHPDPMHNYMKYVNGESKALLNIREGMNFALAHPGQRVPFPTNFDEPPLKNMGNDQQQEAFLAVHLTYARLGVRILLDFRDLMGKEGQNIPQAGGEDFIFGNFRHAFAVMIISGFHQFWRLFRASPRRRFFAEMQSFLEEAETVEILDTMNQDRYFAVGVKTRTGDFEIRVFDFYPEWGREMPWVEIPKSLLSDPDNRRQPDEPLEHWSRRLQSFYRVINPTSARADEMTFHQISSGLYAIPITINEQNRGRLVLRPTVQKARTALVNGFFPFYQDVSEADLLEEQPNVFLLLGNPDLKTFRAFAKHYLTSFNGVPIVVAGGRGSGTGPLLARVLSHYHQSEEDFLTDLKHRVPSDWRGPPDRLDQVEESLILFYILQREGVPQNLIHQEVQASRNTEQNFLYSQAVVQRLAGTNRPHVALVTRPTALTRLKPTAENATKGFAAPWRLSRFKTYTDDFATMSNGELIELVTNTAGYPVESLREAGMLPNEANGNLSVGNELMGIRGQSGKEYDAADKERIQTLHRLLVDFMKHVGPFAFNPSYKRLEPSSRPPTAGPSLHQLNDFTNVFSYLSQPLGMAMASMAFFMLIGLPGAALPAGLTLSLATLAFQQNRWRLAYFSLPRLSQRFLKAPAPTPRQVADQVIKTLGEKPLNLGTDMDRAARLTVTAFLHGSGIPAAQGWAEEGVGTNVLFIDEKSLNTNEKIQALAQFVQGKTNVAIMTNKENLEVPGVASDRIFYRPSDFTAMETIDGARLGITQVILANLIPVLSPLTADGTTLNFMQTTAIKLNTDGLPREQRDIRQAAQKAWMLTELFRSAVPIQGLNWRGIIDTLTLIVHSA